MTVSPPSKSAPRPGDVGSATVLAAAMIVVLLTVTGGGAWLGAAVIARHRAQAAADLAALAAAALLPAGPQAACAAATMLADRLRGHEISCRSAGLDVIVTVAVPIPFAGRQVGAARAAARAGPVNQAG